MGNSVNRPDYLVQQQAISPTVIVTVFEIDPARSPTRPISKTLDPSCPAPPRPLNTTFRGPWAELREHRPFGTALIIF